MTLPIISAYLAAFFGIFQMLLLIAVSAKRGSENTILGDRGSDELLYRIRRHANLTENLPIFLIVLTLLELTGGPEKIVLGFAVLFLVARLSHAAGLSGTDRPARTNAPRALGTVGTLLSVIGASATLLWHLTTTL